MFDSLRVSNRLVPANKQNIKRREDDESNKQAAQTEAESSNTSLAQSRGLQYVQDLQDGKTPQRKPIVNKNQVYPNQYAQNSVNSNGVVNNRVGYNQSVNVSNVQPHVNTSNVAQNPVSQTQEAEEPLSKRISPKINIAQVVGDFKNTAHAIGTPEDIYDEVKTYLDLVEKQTKKDNANVKLVQTNLRSAASLLDGYISATLNKDSKVVENWVEAIFLQQVDYKYNTEDINEAFLVQMPEEKKSSEPLPEQNSEVVTTEPAKPQIDSQLKNLFHQGLKNAGKGNFDAALFNFESAIERSKEVGDIDTQSKIAFEKGKIYDNQDDLPKALEEYNNAITLTKDDNIKIKSHYAMAQIYNDVNQFKPAIEHYMAAIAFAGEKDNLKAQIQSLTKIGDIYSDKYDKEAFNVYEHAEILAEESKDDKNKGYVSSTIANAYDRFNKPTKALKYYSDAVKNYEKAGANNKVALNYQRAGELMIDYKKGDKGKNLIQKAIQYAKKANNEKLVKKLEAEINAA